MATAHAQTIWTPLDHRATARVEFWHAHLKDGGLSTTSGPFFFEVGFPINPKLALSLELPYGRASLNDPTLGPYSDNTVGNPYVGMQLGSLSGRTSFVGELGARFAATNENSILSEAMGILSEMDRVEAFVPKTNTLSAAGNVVLRRATSNVRFRVGVDELFAGSNYGGNNTVVDYGAQATTDVQNFRFGGALTGRYGATAEGNFSERSNHAVTGTASAAFGDFRPGVSVRVPFDKDIRDGAPWMLGLGLELTFR
jgi:hypothetical protein